MTDLSRSVTGSDIINAARPMCIQKLLDIGFYLNGDSFLGGTETAVLKNSPEDHRLIEALRKYSVDMNEYKQSFNSHLPFLWKDGRPVPVDLNIKTNKSKFTTAFVDKIHSDPFYSVYLRIDPEHVVKAASPKRKTTSSHGEYKFTYDIMSCHAKSLHLSIRNRSVSRRTTTKSSSKEEKRKEADWCTKQREHWIFGSPQACCLESSNSAQPMTIQS
jgi:hypothetical protein